eukprot:TRINITY_DN23344_c0_g1_i1.p1 TRINITY_DN23344_c0_g1~~TRINITY_DN23344_c0_g1_i1.p1  ORF type:complete len:222 (-),score=32.02 TRINITY_DN23344_c0_g1_i1:41-667(-)
MRSVLVVLAICVAVCAAGPLWPFDWYSSFNIVDVKNNTLLNFGNWYYHGFSLNSAEMRMDNYHCPHARGEYCTFYFTRQNQMILSHPYAHDKTCCLAGMVGSTPPNWLINATYIGINHNFSNIPLAAWLNVPYTDHYLETLGETRTPAGLAGSSTSLQWNTVTHARPNPSFFELPSHTCTQPCKNSKHILESFKPYMSLLQLQGKSIY